MLSEARGGRLLDARAPAAPTLVACSGGADSTALLLSLRSATTRLVVGHVVHVLRPRSEELADRDRVRALAADLGLGFVEAEIDPPAGENMEAGARRLRYAALARMAAGVGADAVATAHHADDQLESVVMALLRGAGPDGLSGAAPLRPLEPGVSLLRPMLWTSRADAERVCRLAGVAWATDSTNADTRRARARVRARIAPELESMRPGAARRAASAADLLRDAGAVVRDRAHAVFGAADSWPRASLRDERPIVLGAGLRAAILRVSGAGADRLPSRVIEPVVRAVRDRSTERRAFTLAGAGRGVTIVVGAREVSVSPARSGA